MLTNRLINIETFPEIPRMKTRLMPLCWYRLNVVSSSDRKSSFLCIFNKQAASNMEQYGEYRYRFLFL